MTTTGSAQGARARARAELVAEIKDTARRQLSEVGAAALSLRAVARELGMVSSAIYRYFPSRDELLTALIIDTYDAVGDVAELAAATHEPAAALDRWLAVCRAVRAWAIAHVQEYALVYGSPVPGYRAPTDTIAAAARVPNVFLAIARDAKAAGVLEPPRADVTRPAAVDANLAAIGEEAGLDVGNDVVARLVTAWTLLVGSISFELFGHLHNVIDDYEAWFDHEMRNVAHDVGLRSRT